MRTPISRSSARVAIVRLVFSMAVLSVISSSSECGSSPLSVERGGDDVAEIALLELPGREVDRECATAGIVAVCHVFACRQACCKTHSPMGTIIRVSSAMAMNVAGGTMPKPGRFQRSRASIPAICRVSSRKSG